MIWSFNNDPLFDSYSIYYQSEFSQILNSNPRFKNLNITEGVYLFRSELGGRFENDYRFGDKIYIWQLANCINKVIRSHQEIPLSQVIKYALDDLKRVYPSFYDFAQNIPLENLISEIALFDVLVSLLKPEIINEFDIITIQESGIENCKPLPKLSVADLKKWKVQIKRLNKKSEPATKPREESYPLNRTFRKTPRIWQIAYLYKLRLLHQLLTDQKFIERIDFLIVEDHLIKGKAKGDRINWLGSAVELVFLMDSFHEYLEEHCLVSNSIKPYFAHHFHVNGRAKKENQAIYDARKKYLSPDIKSNLKKRLGVLLVIIQEVKKG